MVKEGEFRMNKKSMIIAASMQHATCNMQHQANIIIFREINLYDWSANKKYNST